MGGDHAPSVIIEGAVNAAREYGVGIILAGDSQVIEQRLRAYKLHGLDIEIFSASQVIQMDESAASSVRKKKDSSIAVAVRLIKQGRAQAIVTAGNTGAAVANATLGLRLLPGIERPGIGVLVPTLTGLALIIDAGANIDTKPTHLLQYSIMGDVYMRHI